MLCLAVGDGVADNRTSNRNLLVEKKKAGGSKKSRGHQATGSSRFSNNPSSLTSYCFIIYYP